MWYLVVSLTKILGPLLLSSLRAYFTASFTKSNLINKKKKTNLIC